MIAGGGYSGHALPDDDARSFALAGRDQDPSLYFHERHEVRCYRLLGEYNAHCHDPLSLVVVLVVDFLLLLLVVSVVGVIDANGLVRWLDAYSATKRKMQRVVVWRVLSMTQWNAKPGLVFYPYMVRNVKKLTYLP